MTNDDIEFPINPFNDVEPSEFDKLNKKHVTEDYVEENFRRLGWDVYKPFNDTGIDRIIIKSVCPDGHTPINECLHGKCPVCGKESIQITRFIQVKTRKLKNNTFGFTLKSKDIRIDPRHVYLLYSDNTSSVKQDFLIISVKEYLKFFKNNPSIANPFSTLSFRKGNNKLNSLRYDPIHDKWSWNKVSWECYRNLEGLKRIQDISVDLNLQREIKETRTLSNALLYEFRSGKSFSEALSCAINEKLLPIARGELENNKIRISLARKKANENIINNSTKEVIESSHKYTENVKIRENRGDEEDDE